MVRGCAVRHCVSGTREGAGHCGRVGVQKPPNLHATYSGHEARVRIDPIGLIDGRLPPRELALVVEWATLHESELLENWRRLHGDEPPQPIAPLE